MTKINKLKLDNVGLIQNSLIQALVFLDLNQPLQFPYTGIHCSEVEILKQGYKVSSAPLKEPSYCFFMI